jgi:hypothetical protein
MDSKIDQFLQWLELSGGSFKGAPIPNYAFLLILIIFFIQIILIIIKKIKKYWIDCKNFNELNDKKSFQFSDHNPNAEVELSYGSFIKSCNDHNANSNEMLETETDSREHLTLR